ncbi:MAG: hypothetical protein AAFU79_11755 [Myxococcota bacterium]
MSAGLGGWLLAAAAAAAPAPPACEGRTLGAYDPAHDAEPSLRALAEVQAAYDALCPTRDCGEGALFSNPTAGNNAFTWVSLSKRGAATRAKIVYARRFMDALNERFGPGASFGVLAHEVGHHLTAARALRSKLEPAWNEELRADFLAGCALGRLGRGPEALESAFRALAAVATASHPSFRERVPVMRKGWASCRAEGYPGAPAPLGISRLLPSEPSGCFRYRYRLIAAQRRLGPIGAPLRRSGAFSSKKTCEEHRRQRSVDRDTEACLCVR